MPQDQNNNHHHSTPPTLDLAEALRRRFEAALRDDPFLAACRTLRGALVAVATTFVTAVIVGPS